MKRRGQSHVDMSLVPLADMLTNTVGIMIFVMIFAVLVAQGTFMAMHLPMVTPTKTKSAEFICYDGKILPWRLGELSDKFFTGMPKFAVGNATSFENTVNRRVVSDELFIMRGICTTSYEEDFFSRSARVNYFALELDLRPGVRGETIADIRNPDSIFMREIAKLDPQRYHLTFWVDQNSLDVFRKARELARARHLDSGWFPDRMTWPWRFQLVPDVGGGGKGGFQPRERIGI